MADPTEIRILCAGGNWMRIGALLALGMDGYYSKLPKGSTVAAVTGDPGSSCNDAPRQVAEGNYHLALTPPIFDEAIMTPRWPRIFNQYRMRVLPIDDDVLSDFEGRGYWRGSIAAGRLPGLQHDVPTIDFSGWLLFCREDFPEEWAALAIEAL